MSGVVRCFRWAPEHPELDRICVHVGQVRPADPRRGCVASAAAVLLPIRDSYADGLLAGAYPGSHDPAEAVRRLRAFHEHGITLFVDLTHPADSLAPYERLVRPAARRVGHPIVDMGVPTIRT